MKAFEILLAFVAVLNLSVIKAKYILDNTLRKKIKINLLFLETFS